MADRAKIITKMSNSKIMTILNNNITKKVEKIMENKFYLSEDNIFTFNVDINKYILFEKKVKSKWNVTRYLFTLEKLCEENFICVWFFNNQHIKNSKYNVYEKDLMETVERSEHSKECEGNYCDECNCDYDYQYTEYNHRRQNYQLQYYEKIDISEKDKKEAGFPQLFEFIKDFEFKTCDNCSQLCIKEDVVSLETSNENLCENCLLELDENLKQHNEECPICYDDECLKMKIKTPCNHTFHKECLKTCRNTRLEEENSNYSQCPHCRTEIKDFIIKL